MAVYIYDMLHDLGRHCGGQASKRPASFFMQSMVLGLARTIARRMASFSPPTYNGSRTTLNKAAFRKTVAVLGLKVTPARVATVLKSPVLKPYAHLTTWNSTA